MEALKAREAAEPAPKLDGKQLRHLYMLITSNNPLPLGFELALWTRALVDGLLLDDPGVYMRPPARKNSDGASSAAAPAPTA